MTIKKTLLDIKNEAKEHRINNPEIKQAAALNIIAQKYGFEKYEILKYHADSNNGIEVESLANKIIHQALDANELYAKQELFSHDYKNISDDVYSRIKKVQLECAMYSTRRENTYTREFLSIVNFIEIELLEILENSIAHINLTLLTEFIVNNYAHISNLLTLNFGKIVTTDSLALILNDYLSRLDPLWVGIMAHTRDNTNTSLAN
ncbi:MAG: hypothetical protein DRI86_00950 [Bacteroidetes bacterium]|nr:MAG: hypothetical protein DRI86_00950 [Bacteroidota bacterium]